MEPFLDILVQISQISNLDENFSLKFAAYLLIIIIYNQSVFIDRSAFCTYSTAQM